MPRRIRLLAGLLLAPRPPGPAGAAQPYPRGAAGAVASPQLDIGALDAAGRRLLFGHLRLELASGTLHPVRAGGHLVGAFFTGQGSFRYVSSDPIEAATYRENVERTTSYQVDAEGG